MKEVLSWDRLPISIDDFQLHWLEVKDANQYDLVLFSFAAAAWNLWNIRNKMAFDQRYPKQPLDVIYSFLSCLQHWIILLKEKDREHFGSFMSTFTSWAKEFGASSKLSPVVIG